VGDARLDPDDLVPAAVGVVKAEAEQRAHVGDDPALGGIRTFGDEAAPNLAERFLVGSIEREVVEAAALKIG
jgi:hypothetical protein